jgi:hypothetical protein
MRARIGEPVHALTLNSRHNRRNGDFTEALSDNFLKMLVPGCHPANQWVEARAEQVAGDMLVTSVPQDPREERLQ